MMSYEEFSRVTNNFDELSEITRNEYSKPTYLHNIVISFGECGFRCINITFFVYNLLFSMVGMTILFIGILMHTTRNDASLSYTQMAGIEGYMDGPIILMAIGILTLSLSFLACFGSRKNNIFTLSFYLVLLFLITVSEFGLVVLAYSHRAQIENSLKVDFQKTLNRYNLPNNERVSQSIDTLQSEFKCCGNDGYSDWQDTKWWQQHGGNYSVPQSCCVIPGMKNCNRDVKTKLETIFTDGCYDHIRKYLFENLHVISGFAVWLVVLEFLGIMFSIILIYKIRKENKLKNDEKEDSFYRSNTIDY